MMLKKLLIFSLLSILLLPNSQITYAANAADWNAGNIIGDGLFANANAMSVANIQTFLNQKVGTGGSAYATPGFCDTEGTRTSEFGGGTRAQYAASVGKPTPFTCLKDYYEVPKTDPAPGVPANNYGGVAIPAGAKSAAQLIWDAGQRYSINPRVLLVMIQKESAGPLVTDDWPFLSQYTYAMGARCPDSGPGGAANCDANYAGFSMQIQESARLLRYYITNMDQPWWTYKKLGNNTILYQNSKPECGSSNVNIVTRATAALYTYTPYQPNQAALNNLYGTGDACSAYGNRNFWRMFTDWFGSTQINIPYAWSVLSQEAYSNNSRTQPYTSAITSLPNGKIYMRIKARNVGLETWNNSFVRLGTSNPQGRISVFQDGSWLSPDRVTALQESTVNPGETGTFEFAFSAPSNTGSYTEYFNMVADGYSWFYDIGLYYAVNVVAPTSPVNAVDSTLISGEEITISSFIMSPDTQSVLRLQTDGNLVLYSNFSNPVWSSGTSISTAGRLVMQPDGNLVLYKNDGKPAWFSNTYGNPGARLEMQADGNMVVYTSGNTPIWASSTAHNPNHLSYVNTELYPATLLPFQSIETATRKYRLVLQPDSNLVLYSNNSPVWASGTSGRNVSHLALQPDGNLVLYDKSGSVVWHTNTFRSGASKLVIQPDGNLVLYNTAQSTWNSETAGR